MSHCVAGAGLSSGFGFSSGFVSVPSVCNGRARGTAEGVSGCEFSVDDPASRNVQSMHLNVFISFCLLLFFLNWLFANDARGFNFWHSLQRNDFGVEKSCSCSCWLCCERQYAIKASVTAAVATHPTTIACVVKALSGMTLQLLVATTAREEGRSKQSKKIIYRH